MTVHVTRDRTLRVKILDACGMTCRFCHNEGTPVAADNRTRPVPLFTTAGSSGRVSIYTATNGVNFLPATVPPGSGYSDALARLRTALGYDELHLTGGEPTLHPHLADIVRDGTAAGYRVRMTSNGENGARVIPAAARAGLEKVNFSVFGTTPDELAQVQHARFSDHDRAARKIAALKASIQACADHGVRADANLVVLDTGHIDRAIRLLEQYSATLSVRLLNSLDHGQRSLNAIAAILDRLGAREDGHYVTAGVSGCRTAYRIDGGRRIFVKLIRPTRLPETCAGCRFNNGTDCTEGFYGTRLYRARDSRWMVGVCIQRMDLCRELDEFLAGDLPGEILRLRETDYAALTSKGA
jgi:cyclic pyranopterin phosphate synthase